MLAAGATPPPLFRDGTPRTGLSLEYDIVVIDCKDAWVGGGEANEEVDTAMVPVLQVLAQAQLGVVLLLRDSAMADARTKAMIAAAADWEGRMPVLLCKPMVSSLLLCQCAVRVTAA